MNNDLGRALDAAAGAASNAFNQAGNMFGNAINAAGQGLENLGRNIDTAVDAGTLNFQANTGAYDSRGIRIDGIATAKGEVDKYREEIKSYIDQLVVTPNVQSGYKGEAQVQAIYDYLDACRNDLNKIYDYLGTFSESLSKVQANYEAQVAAAGKVASSAEQGLANEGTISTQAEGGVKGFGG